MTPQTRQQALQYLREPPAQKNLQPLIFGASPLGLQLFEGLKANGFANVARFDERIAGSIRQALRQWAQGKDLSKSIVIVAITEDEALGTLPWLEEAFAQLGVFAVLHVFDLGLGDASRHAWYAACRRRWRFCAAVPFARVGRGTDIGEVRVTGFGRLTLGMFARIGDGVHFLLEPAPDANANSLFPPPLLPGGAALPLASIEVGDGVSVGANALIGPNVKIGEHALIRPGAVVLEDVPPFAIVSGSPAKVESLRFSPERRAAVAAAHWPCWPLDALSEAGPALAGEGALPVSPFAKTASIFSALTDVLPVCLAVDERVVEPTLVVLDSLRQTHPLAQVEVHVLQSALPEAQRARIARLIADFAGWSLVFHDIDAGRFAEFRNLADYLSRASYYRYLIPDFLPEHARAFYFDCDLLICDDLTPLWQTELGDAYAAGVSELSTRTDWFRQHLQKLGFGPEDVYVNSGVLLLNLEQMRQDGIVGKLFEQTTALSNLPGFADQDALNVLCKGRLKTVDGRWNRGVLPCFLKDDESPIETAGILHYAGAVKPWQDEAWWRGRHYKALKRWEKAYLAVLAKLGLPT
ncbi:MAG: hypothetical protein LBL69_07160 [Zoogloeaceae bacterium]|jgi:lipopolysaccharide biosynthesis glycosyltransferase/acetyltransferase-like isoleucine patch superfamily enzyme|nr:hypothetical protein [Zoogloeaceae bacterium]